MSNRTSESDCPQKLRPGDLVKASMKQRYLTWIVREVSQTDELRQKVTASAPGLGSVRFEWFGGHHRTGKGHGMVFYFVGHGTPPGWNEMKTAPKNAAWCRVIMADGSVGRAHWAEGLSGEEQPPYRGWFREAGSGHHVQIRDPIGWLPDER